MGKLRWKYADASLISLRDRSVCISSLNTRRRILGPLIHALGVQVTAVTFSYDEDVAASAGRDGKIHVWNISTGKRLNSIDISSRPITSVQFVQDNSKIVVGCNDSTLSLWDIHTGAAVVGSPIGGHLNTVSSVALSSDGSIIASGSHDSKIRLWEYVECTKLPLSLQVQGHRSEITVVTFNIENTLVASGDSSGVICIWSCRDGGMIRRIPDAHVGSVSTLAFSKDGKLLSGGDDTTVTCWSLGDGDMLWSSKDTTDLGHERRVSASTFSNGGSTVATGGEDRYIFLWDAESGEPLVDEPLERDDGYWIERLAFSADDGKLLSVDVHEQKTQWDVDSKALIEGEIMDDFIEPPANSRKLRLDETGWVFDDLTSKRIFWIPADHRGNAWTVSKEMFVIGNRHGVVTIIDISEVL